MPSLTVPWICGASVFSAGKWGEVERGGFHGPLLPQALADILSLATCQAAPGLTVLTFSSASLHLYPL